MKRLGEQFGDPLCDVAKQCQVTVGAGRIAHDDQLPDRAWRVVGFDGPVDPLHAITTYKGRADPLVDSTRRNAGDAAKSRQHAGSNYA